MTAEPTPTPDLPTELREIADFYSSEIGRGSDYLREAADLIDRLRADLAAAEQRIANQMVAATELIAELRAAEHRANTAEANERYRSRENTILRAKVTVAVADLSRVVADMQDADERSLAEITELAERAEAAEQAIERVRVLCGNPPPGGLLSPDHVLAALGAPPTSPDRGH